MDFDDLEGLKKKKRKIRGDRGQPATNPPLIKLVFYSEIGNSKLMGIVSGKTYLCLSEIPVFIGSENGYLLNNFPYLYGVRKV